MLPAVRDEEGLRRALHADQDILFVLYGDILTLEANVGSILKTGRMPFIHLDMITRWKRRSTSTGSTSATIRRPNRAWHR